MSLLARILPLRLMLPLVAASLVFVLAGGFYGPQHSSFAQDTAAAPEKGSPSTGDVQTIDGSGKRISCASLPEARGGFLLGRIVPCLVHTIQTSASRYSRAMIELLRPPFFAFLTFILVLFGVQVLQNEGQLQARAFVLLFKIGLSLTILAMIPGDPQTGEGGLIGAAYGIMTESQAAVMSAIGPDQANIHCDIQHFGDANTPMIWAQMDCLLGKLYGFTTGAPGPSGQARPNMLLASSILGLLGGFFFGGTLGAILFFALVGVLISMFMLVLRVLIAFVNSYLFVALYMIIAPLLLPTMFLRVTGQMFERWYSGIIAALLMPMIICAYVVLALQLYDRLLFADDALINQIFNQEWIRPALQLPRQACGSNLANNPTFRAQSTGMSEQQVYTGNRFLSGNFVNPLINATNHFCIPNIPVLDGNALPNTRGFTTAQQKFEKLFQDCAKLFIMTMLINMGFKTVIGAVRTMVGSSAVVASLDAKTPMEERFQAGFQQARTGFERTIRYGESGTEGEAMGTGFLARVPVAFRSGAQGFMSGITGRDMSSPPPPQSGSSAGSGSDDDDTPNNNTNSSGSGGNNNTANRNNAATPPPAARTSGIRSNDPAARREAAAAALSAPELQRFDSLELTLARRDLPAAPREQLQAEYDRLVAQIEQGEG